MECEGACPILGSFELTQLGKRGVGLGHLEMEPIEYRLVSVITLSDWPTHVMSTMVALNHRADRNQETSLDHVAQKMLPAKSDAVAGQRFLNDGRVRVVEKPRLRWNGAATGMSNHSRQVMLGRPASSM